MNEWESSHFTFHDGARTHTANNRTDPILALADLRTLWFEVLRVAAPARPSFAELENHLTFFFAALPNLAANVSSFFCFLRFFDFSWPGTSGLLPEGSFVWVAS